MLWKLGDEAIFNCDPRYYNMQIPSIYASSNLRNKYQNWRQLDKKHVVVDQIINTASNTYRVFLKEDGKSFTLIINGSDLSKLQPAAPVGCTCTNQTLMIRGCVCGHFVKEVKVTLHTA